VAVAAAGCEIVYHLAAEVSVPRSVADPRATYDVNATGTLNVLLAARDAGCRRVIAASTSADYGDGPELRKREAMLRRPISPYAASKLAGEHLCAVFTHAYGLETVALRYFNVYGPRQDLASACAAAIPAFLGALLAGGRPVVFGDGDQTRDFVYVGDVVAAYLRAAAAPKAASGVYNIASGSSVTLNEVLAHLADELGVQMRPDSRPPRPGDIRHSGADVALAASELCFAAAVPLDEGIARLVAAARGMAD
jgi:UDP-glucose 4-epimerase